MSRTYSRDDVERCYHDTCRRSDHYCPHANVKVRGSVEAVFTRDEPDIPDGLTYDWIEDHLTEEQLDALFWLTCEVEWETLQSEAEEIFGAGVEVHAGGRSSGWACVTGLPDLEQWDAVMLGKWRRFERYARAIADGIPEQMVYSIAANEWETAQAAELEQAGQHRDVAPALV